MAVIQYSSHATHFGSNAFVGSSRYGHARIVEFSGRARLRRACHLSRSTSGVASPLPLPLRPQLMGFLWAWTGEFETAHQQLVVQVRKSCDDYRAAFDAAGACFPPHRCFPTTPIFSSCVPDGVEAMIGLGRLDEAEP